MSELVKNYYKILETIESLNIDCKVNKVGRRPKMSDNEIVALSLTAEYRSIDSENLLFQMIPENGISNILERSQFNKRRRKLFAHTELIRTKLKHSFVEFEDYFVVDSMPLEICKMARHKRTKICKERFETAPGKGFAHLKTHGFMVINCMEFAQCPVFFIPLILVKQMSMILLI